MELVNHTPFSAGYQVRKDDAGEDVLHVAIKAVYSFDRDASLSLASVQDPIVVEDEYYGDPETSALRYSSDYSPVKDSTDIALVGEAVAVDGGSREMVVSLRVGDLESTLVVSGDRSWKKRLGFFWLSKPEALQRLPLVYDRSFGGLGYECNPIGIGYSSAGNSETSVMVPNIESLKERIRSIKDRPCPAGYGFISPLWHCEKENQSAHPDLIYPGFLKGDERVEISGIFHENVAFELPSQTPSVRLAASDGRHDELDLFVEKLFIDTFEQKVSMVWNSMQPVSRRLFNLERIEVV